MFVAIITFSNIDKDEEEETVCYFLSAKTKEDAIRKIKESVIGKFNGYGNFEDGFGFDEPEDSVDIELLEYVSRESVDTSEWYKEIEEMKEQENQKREVDKLRYEAVKAEYERLRAEFGE